jgi:glycosyltransferase involved in cell wall biosynthesis
VGESSILPIHLGVHYLACAVAGPDGVRTRTEAGRMIEGLAEGVERLTLVAYDPPAAHPSNEDVTDYLIRTTRGNVDFLSLGPKGGWRDFASRGRRVRGIVSKASGDWDVIMVRLVNRRAHTVWSANKCPRVVVHVGGSLLAFALRAPARTLRKARMLAYGLWAEFNQRRIIRAADLTFVVGEDLLARYARIAKHAVIVRGSALRRRDLQAAADRLQRPEPRFLFCGQVHPSKGIFDVVAAFARIRSNVLPDARLDVVGDGPGASELRALADEIGVSDAVTYHGWITDRDALFDLYLYRRMDVLLCLSRVDFLPRVIWEALGSSVLVIATAVGSVPTVFADVIKIVPVSDAAAVENVVRELLAHPESRSHMLERGLMRAEEATLETFTGRFLGEIASRWPELGAARG